MRRFAALLIAALLALAPGVALADVAPLVPAGPTLQPVAETSVRMESEHIEIRVYQKEPDPKWFIRPLEASVKVTFRFVPGADEVQEIGFPLGVTLPDNGMMTVRVENFGASVGGKSLPVQQRRVTWDGRTDDWAVWRMEFRRGEPVDLEVTYTMPVHPFGKTEAADLWILYILRTGRYWDSTIGKATARFRLDRPIRAEDLRPDRDMTAGWVLKDGALHWEQHEFEPDFDLTVRMANAFWLDHPADMERLIRQESLSRMELLEAAYGVMRLLQGDGRLGSPMPVRGGESDEAGMNLFPLLEPRLSAAVAQTPEDWELRETYLRALYSAAWAIDVEGARLRDPLLYRTFLARAAEYRRDGGPELEGPVFLPWTVMDTVSMEVDEALAADLLGYTRETMPSRFSSEEAARTWVAGAMGRGGQRHPSIPESLVAALTADAISRAVPAEPGAVAQKPGGAPAPVSSPTAGSPSPEKEGSGAGWLPWAAAALLSAAAVTGAIVTRSRRS